MEWQDRIPEDIRDLYEIHNYHHAAEVLATSYQQEFDEIMNALRNFRISEADLMAGGGNESTIPKKFSEMLRPLSWYETKIQGDLLIRKIVSGNGAGQTIAEELKIEKFLDGHKVDYVKNQVAFDLEWNSKDQTFDRDLYAFRAFHECRLIGAAVLVTRSEAMNTAFKRLGIMKKYGASTTWMGKLLYRLNAGRNGGCPVLVFGITPKVINGG